MTSRLGTLARAGLVALAMGGSGAAFAGPAGLTPLDIANGPLPVTPVQWRCDGSAGRPNACRNNDTGEVRSREDLRDGRENDRPRYARDRDRDEYRGRDRDDDRRYDRRRDRDEDWRWRDRDRRDDYRYRRHGDDRVYFNLGIIPAPRYVAPAPRYRVNVTRAHIAWCHDRWRSYRAYDNSYQPNYGPRRQCISPYS